MDRRYAIILEVNTLAFNLSNNFQVTYQTDLFLDKNKDYVVAEHQALLSASKCSFVSCLFPPLAEESSKSSKFSSIGSRFKVWYSSLLGIGILDIGLVFLFIRSSFFLFAASIGIPAGNSKCYWAPLHSMCKAQ